MNADTELDKRPIRVRGVVDNEQENGQEENEINYDIVDSLEDVVDLSDYGLTDM